ncbi:hypothetical protein [Leisingera aquaemixtae]|uniref:hypothetical protein n=1 Tax=Leisingera aquaemixtae TaxID=1396826 RepID=UPI0021A91D2B|nr:hypothetical protein [Leisingera aquaemixtae]UWQ46336.1 hypothetical protein K3719_02950 [Leisingera aquaemixtae]
MSGAKTVDEKAHFTKSPYFPNLNCGPLLHPKSHGILLGVLKKIEMKSAALSGVSVFLTSVLLSNFSEYSKLPYLIGFSYWFLVGFLVGPLLAVIDGVGHLGQSHYRKLEPWYLEAVRAREMQMRLMLDLLVKERVFKTSVWLVGAGILGSIALAAIAFGCDPEKLSP